MKRKRKEEKMKEERKKEERKEKKMEEEAKPTREKNSQTLKNSFLGLSYEFWCLITPKTEHKQNPKIPSKYLVFGIF